MTNNKSSSVTFSDDYYDAPEMYQNQTLVEQVTSYVVFYYTPLLIALGTIGNLVSVFVFYSSKLRLQSTSQYLSALAISDTIFLFQLLPPWLNALPSNYSTDLFYRKGFCEFFVYIAYVTSCLSAWLVVAFTIERFVAVLYPLQRNAICTISRARYIILGIVVAALLLNIPILRFAKATTNDCGIDHDYMDSAARFNLVDAIVTFSIPLIVIVIMNTWIMIGVWRLEHARHQLLKAETPAMGSTGTGHGAGPPRPPRSLACPRSQQRVTRMLLIVSSVYVVLNLPAYAIRMLAYAYDVENNERWGAIQNVATMFFDTNFGINFILYCLSGQNFRRALRQTIPWLRRRARRGVAVRRATSCHPARASSVSTSYVSNCTEATSNWPVASTSGSTRRKRREPFISRWTFDNSRQRHKMAAATAAGTTDTTISTTIADHFELQPIPISTQI